MKLSSDLKKSLAAYTADLKGDISITLQKGSHKKRDDLVTFLNKNQKIKVNNFL